MSGELPFLFATANLVNVADFVIAEWEMQETAQQLMIQQQDEAQLSADYRLDITYRLEL